MLQTFRQWSHQGVILNHHQLAIKLHSVRLPRMKYAWVWESAFRVLVVDCHVVLSNGLERYHVIKEITLVSRWNLRVCFLYFCWLRNIVINQSSYLLNIWTIGESPSNALSWQSISHMVFISVVSLKLFFFLHQVVNMMACLMDIIDTSSGKYSQNIELFVTL